MLWGLCAVFLEDCRLIWKYVWRLDEMMLLEEDLCVCVCVFMLLMISCVLEEVSSVFYCIGLCNVSESWVSFLPVRDMTCSSGMKNYHVFLNPFFSQVKALVSLLRCRIRQINNQYGSVIWSSPLLFLMLNWIIIWILLKSFWWRVCVCFLVRFLPQWRPIMPWGKSSLNANGCANVCVWVCVF